MCRSSAKVQKRVIFRKQYDGTTLRENLGLAAPKNRFLEGR
jgi:alkanesulfonate monooxygenase